MVINNPEITLPKTLFATTNFKNFTNQLRSVGKKLGHNNLRGNANYNDVHHDKCSRHPLLRPKT